MRVLTLLLCVLALLTGADAQRKPPGPPPRPKLSPTLSYQGGLRADWWNIKGNVPNAINKGVKRAGSWHFKKFVDPNLGASLVWNFDQDRYVLNYKYPAKGKRQFFGPQYCQESRFTSFYTDPGFFWFEKAKFVGYDTIKRHYSLRCQIWQYTSSEGTHAVWVTYDSKTALGKPLIARDVFNAVDVRGPRKSYHMEIMSMGTGRVDTRAFTVRSNCQRRYEGDKYCYGDGCGRCCWERDTYRPCYTGPYRMGGGNSTVPAPLEELQQPETNVEPLVIHDAHLIGVDADGDMDAFDWFTISPEYAHLSIA